MTVVTFAALGSSSDTELDIESVRFDASPTKARTLLYFTGIANELTNAAQRADLGLLGTPAGSTWRQKVNYPAGWAADNGCFVDVFKPGSFNAAKWLAWLELVGPADCYWATLPDVVGDPRATWLRSVPYIERVRELGFPLASVMQNGLQHERGIWSEMLEVSDCLFVGGSPECVPCGYVRPGIETQRKHCPFCARKLTEWKLDTPAAQLVAEAKNVGKLVHVGRVNSLKRLLYSASIGADTADGTYLNFGRSADREKNTHRLFGWLDQVNA